MRPRRNAIYRAQTKNQNTMKLTTDNLDTVETPTPAKAPRKRKAASKRAPRVVDPRIVAANERRNLEVAAIRSEDASSRMLRVIIEKRLPKMTMADKERLAHHLPTMMPPLPL